MKELVFNLNDNHSQLQMIIIRIKKTPQLRGEKLSGLLTVNLFRYPQVTVG